MLKWSLSALICAGTFTPALAAEPVQNQDWFNSLSFVSPPALEIDSRSERIEGRAHIVVKNNGSAPSKRIEVECSIYDQAGNTVDMMIAWISAIQPGKLGITDATSINLSQNARDISCELHPFRRYDD
jgi:hypothetical protein